MPFPRKSTFADEREPHERLTLVEYAVAMRIAKGIERRKIRTDLCFSYKTYDLTVVRIVRKMELIEASELVHYAAVRGLWGVEKSSAQPERTKARKRGDKSIPF